MAPLHLPVLALLIAVAGALLLCLPGKSLLVFFARLTPPRLRHHRRRPPRVYLTRLRLIGVVLVLVSGACTLLAVLPSP